MSFCTRQKPGNCWPKERRKAHGQRKKNGRQENRDLRQRLHVNGYILIQIKISVFIHKCSSFMYRFRPFTFKGLIVLNMLRVAKEHVHNW